MLLKVSLKLLLLLFLFFFFFACDANASQRAVFISGLVFFGHLVKRLPFSKGVRRKKKKGSQLCISDPNYANYQKFKQGPGLLSPNPEVIDSIKNA